jgi:hypothetical protein
MACPFFMPVARLERGDWIHAPRLPLGDPYRGICHAVEGEPFEPTESDQRDLCNCGYARGHCNRVPGDSADAVRFSVANDKGGLIKITWVIEKDHSPVEFGTLEYCEGKLLDARSIGGTLLATQASAFIESYVDLQKAVQTAVAAIAL